MKFLSKFNQRIAYIFSLTVILSLFALSSCGSSGSTPSATEIATNQLRANTWRINTVTVDGVDQTSLFSGMTLSFTATNYTTTNGKVVWPASGMWSFTDDTAKKIKRSDNLEVSIVDVTTTTLKLSLTWATGTLGTGRIESVAGNHVFSFVK
jgi:hypothetical protein